MNNRRLRQLCEDARPQPWSRHHAWWWGREISCTGSGTALAWRTLRLRERLEGRGNWFREGRGQDNTSAHLSSNSLGRASRWLGGASRLNRHPRRGEVEVRRGSSYQELCDCSTDLGWPREWRSIESKRTPSRLVISTQSIGVWVAALAFPTSSKRAWISDCFHSEWLKDGCRSPSHLILHWSAVNLSLEPSETWRSIRLCQQERRGSSLTFSATVVQLIPSIFLSRSRIHGFLRPLVSDLSYFWAGSSLLWLLILTGLYTQVFSPCCTSEAFKLLCVDCEATS